MDVGAIEQETPEQQDKQTPTEPEEQFCQPTAQDQFWSGGDIDALGKWG